MDLNCSIKNFGRQCDSVYRGIEGLSECAQWAAAGYDRAPIEDGIAFSPSSDQSCASEYLEVVTHARLGCREDVAKLENPKGLCAQDP